MEGLKSGGPPVVVVGAGAVGLAIGTRLARAGTPVHFVVRRAQAARSIDTEGVALEDPATGEVVRARASASLEGPAATSGPILLCLRAGDDDGMATRIARRWPDAPIVSAQNDVDSEPTLARSVTSVHGLVVRQTCTRKSDRHVLATGRGRLVLGRYPEGLDETDELLGAQLARAGFDVGLSRDIMADKWLKLFVNLMSAVNALVQREDHAGRAFVELKVRLLEEARAAFTAAGIRAVSYDGRDRSIDEEIRFIAGSLASGASARDLPLYNACWSALADPTRPLEADAYHARILELASAHGLRAPTHRAVLDCLVATSQSGVGPERERAEQLLARARGAAA